MNYYNENDPHAAALTRELFPVRAKPLVWRSSNFEQFSYFAHAGYDGDYRAEARKEAGGKWYDVA